MTANGRKILLALILIAAAILLYVGWKRFWFLTDDAFIAFRYVSNSMLGYGYTWNAPPFRPVEGYTSFLWVVLLDFIWRAFDIQPPDIINHLSLGFSCLTLFLVTWTILRMELAPVMERWRLVFLPLILLGILSNRTFLAWTSSGMETAMFNFFFTLWVFIAILGRQRSCAWTAGLTGSAVLVYLSRPDGIAVVLSSVLMLYFSLRFHIGQGTLNKKWFFSVSPLLIVATHLLWRKSFYGEWLPNTYYAKVVVPWPEAGLRYFASFVLEYGLCVWLFLLLVLVYSRLKKSGFLNWHKKPPTNGAIPPSFPNDAKASVFTAISIATLLFHFGYYTFVVGGDHFEYRVYSHLIPLIFLSFLWMLNRLRLKPRNAALLLVLFTLISLPLPWIHWKLMKDTRASTTAMQTPISGKFPSVFHVYTEAFDSLQEWLIKRLICIRHQEHKIFYEYHTWLYPSRATGKNIRGETLPVLASGTVGVPGWALPHVAILDELGLNDYVIARSPFRRTERLMAHERVPPPGYVESFQPNVLVDQPGHISITIQPPSRNLTNDYIIATERYWINEIKIMNTQLEEMSQRQTK